MISNAQTDANASSAPRSRSLEWASLFLVLAAILAFTLILIKFQKQADNYRRVETLLARLASTAQELNGLEWEGIARQQVTDETQHHLSLLQNETAVLIWQLALTSDHSEDIEEVSRRHKTYMEVVDREFKLIKAGRISEARALDEEKVDPAFRALDQAITQAIARYADTAERGIWSAHLSALFTVLFTTVAFAFLFWQLGRARLASRLAVAGEKELRDANETLRTEISERQRVEQRLADALNFNRTVLEASPEGIIIYEAAGRASWANKAASRITGGTAEQLLTQEFRQIESWQRSGLLAAAEKALTTGEDQEIEANVFTSFGKNVWLAIRLTAFSFEGKKHLLVVLTDVTERRQIGESLRRSEERYRNLVENAQDIVFTIAPDAAMTSLNPAFESITGRPLAEWVGKLFTALIHPDDLPLAMDMFQLVLSGRKTPLFELRILTQSGRPLFMEFTANPQFDDGKIVGVLGIGRQVTERKRAEEQLRKLSRAVEQSPVSIVITDAAGNIDYVNPGFTQLTGYTAGEVLGKNPRILKSGEMPPEVYREIWRTITAGGEWRGELHNRRKNGELYWESASISAIHDEAGNITHYLAVKEDITEHRRLEAELRQSQKMEAVGQLAGGIAHDFNNILTVIQGNISMLQMSSVSADEHAVILKDVLQAAERATNLIRQLLTFSRRQAMQPKNLDLNEVVSGTTRLLQRLIGEHIVLETRYDPGDALVRADRGMIDQVLINLAVNARDAMPKGGQLTIQTSTVLIREEDVRFRSRARAGRFVRLSVSDTGTGIAPQDLPHIFEPFFTTKEVGKGTGLGLATVFGIAEQHLGWIEVESQPDIGTTFSIYLPYSAKMVALEARPRDGTMGSEGTETILLVEDETPVRLLISKVLAKHGYRVLEAESGVAALEVWKAHRDRVDLLLTDMVMPGGLNGRKLAEQLMAEKPDLRVIYSSGYASEASSFDPSLSKSINFLPKPYEADLLLQKVRACLDAP